MIDNMVEVLGREQQDDDDKKEYCGKQLDFADDKKKMHESDISELERQIAQEEDAIAMLADEIASLGDGIKALDKAVAEATEQRREEHADVVTEQRREEHADYTELIA